MILNVLHLCQRNKYNVECVPWRVCKYYYCWFDCIAYQECCDRWGPLWLTGPLYPPFPYKLDVINLLKLPPLLQPKNKRVLITFIRNINVTMIILNNCRNWSVSVRSDTNIRQKIITDEKEKEKILWQVHSAPHAGHSGVNATADKITPRFYWKGVKGDVKT